jgi:hypothetical protein
MVIPVVLEQALRYELIFQGQVVVFDLSIRSRHIWCCGEPLDGRRAENCSIVLLRNFPALVADKMSYGSNELPGVMHVPL